MKIIVSEAQLKQHINELFSQKLVLQLVHKFREEDNTIPPETLDFYINRFQQIKDSPKVVNKDITTYSWIELRSLIDNNQPQKVDIGIDNSNLIYDKDNLKIYLANSGRACVKYGNGYNFCISSRGEDNAYSQYRLGEKKTIYFVVDEDKSREKTTNPDADFTNEEFFVDPTHLIIIMAKNHYFTLEGRRLSKITYQITDANNEPGGTENFKDWEHVTQFYPKLKNLQDIFVPVQPNQNEKGEFNLRLLCDTNLRNLMHIHWVTKKDHKVKLTDYAEMRPEYLVFYTPDKKYIPYIDMILNAFKNNQPIYYYLTIDQYGVRSNHSQVSSNRWSKDEWENKINKGKSKNKFRLHERKVINYEESYITYLEKVKETMLNYFHEKNKLNIPTEPSNT